MKKHIVVIGGGFAGISAIKTLLKHQKELDVTITLVDKNHYHTFTPSLYEVATSEEPQQNIAIPFFELFGKKIAYKHGEVTKIDTAKQLILVGNEQIFYDYLILSAGSIPSYHHIPGLKEHSITLKTIADAVRIKEKIQTLCCKEGVCNRKCRLIIGGGGFSGTELTAELLTYKDRLAKQFGLARNCLDITIIQGSSRVLPELAVHVSRIAQKRISSPMVHFAFGGHIQQVTRTEVQTDDKKTYPFDLLIWTGGVEASKLAAISKLLVNKHGQVKLNSFLQVSPTIFAAGDIAGFINDKTQKPAPQVAEVAQDQGFIAGENVYRTITSKQLLPYRFHHLGYIVPLRGKFAAAELMGWLHFDGYVGWIIQQLVFLRYLLEILPFWKALKRWNVFEEHLTQ